MAVGPRTILAGRFQIEETVGTGGMATVARARDLHSGSDIAIKVLHKLNPSAQDHERFAREARVLATLRHPGIVSYVAHGTTPEGQPFLAMEWLTGEDLQQRLQRQQLTAGESLTLLRGIARALREVHDHELIHRDLKPSNLFLRDYDIEKVTLIDFGIARQEIHFDDEPLTQTGLVVGTPAFMAPEQARGQQDIGPSADIFSLGCILYTCLIGAPPFAGECFAATLARILFEEPPNLRALRPELPESLATMLSRMLDKVPANRIANARVLSEALDQLGNLADFGTPTAVHRPTRTTAIREELELELVSVIVAAEWNASTARVALDPDTQEAWRVRHRSLRSELLVLGARSEQLADGSLVVTLRQASATAATDQATRAARCALLIHERWAKATIVITTGLGVTNNRLPIGEAIDRATRFLRDCQPLGGDGGPWLDHVTSNLIGPSFKITPMANGMQQLVSEQIDADETRRLVGRPTPCVGREFELGQLDALLVRCIDELSPGALLITSPPGVGKSRVRHEFLRRLRVRRGEDGVEILAGRGDPMSAGASYGLLSQALRRLCGVMDGESPADRREKLQQRVMRHVASDAAVHTVSFIGELCSIPFPVEYNGQLRAARHDPKVMSDQISSALVCFLRAECAHKPMLLVLEDLHWGDALTVKLVETALQDLRESPFMVLALARPEIQELFPRLWSTHVHQIALNRLSKRACEQLITEVLGNDLPRQTVVRIISQSEGNAFFLEELIRAVIEHKGSEVPETIVAMLQARIGRLSVSARRLLRAASIFGETFWRGGVKLLLGQPATRGGSETSTSVGVAQGSSPRQNPPTEDGTDPDLTELTAAEMIQRGTGSRFPGESEYSFRHALIREAAYGLLTDENRQQGHALAGQYLESVGEHDPLLLAEHYQRSGDAERALGFLIRAAIQALEGNDLVAALARAERAVQIGVQGEQLGTLRSVQAWAQFWSADLAAAFTSAKEAVLRLPAGSLFWCSAMGSLFLSGGLAGKQAEMPAFIEPFVTTAPTSEARTQYVQAACSLASVFSLSGNREKATLFLNRISEIAQDDEAQDASMRGWVRHAHNWHVRFLEPDPWRALVTAEQAVAAFTEAGDLRMRATEEVYLGISQWDLGDPLGAEATLRRTLEVGLRLQESLVVRLVYCYLPQILLEHDNPDELAEIETMALTVHRTAAHTYYGGLALSLLSQVALRRDKLEDAAASARKAVEFLRIAPPLQPIAYTSLIHVLLRQGQRAMASHVADEAAALIDSIRGAGRQELACRLAIVEAKRVAESSEVSKALRIALAELTRRADAIPDAGLRRRFLEQPADNARILALARDYKLLT